MPPIQPQTTPKITITTQIKHLPFVSLPPNFHRQERTNNHANPTLPFFFSPPQFYLITTSCPSRTSQVHFQPSYNATHHHLQHVPTPLKTKSHLTSKPKYLHKPYHHPYSTSHPPNLSSLNSTASLPPTLTFLHQKKKNKLANHLLYLCHHFGVKPRSH